MEHLAPFFYISFLYNVVLLVNLLIVILGSPNSSISDFPEASSTNELVTFTALLE